MMNLQVLPSGPTLPAAPVRQEWKVGGHRKVLLYSVSYSDGQAQKLGWIHPPRVDAFPFRAGCSFSPETVDAL